MSEEKAQAFDNIHQLLKRKRLASNIHERKQFYAEVIRMFDWELILIGKYNMCKKCGTDLPTKVINWAFANEIRWFCVECFNKIIKGDPIGREFSEHGYQHISLVKVHIKSFKRMMKKKEKK